MADGVKSERVEAKSKSGGSRKPGDEEYNKCQADVRKSRLGARRGKVSLGRSARLGVLALLVWVRRPNGGAASVTFA